MTQWQWNILMALVRYVLRKEGLMDFGQEFNNGEEERQINDMNILNEAVIRDI